MNGLQHRRFAEPPRRPGVGRRDFEAEREALQHMARRMSPDEWTQLRVACAYSGARVMRTDGRDGAVHVFLVLMDGRRVREIRSVAELRAAALINP